MAKANPLRSGRNGAITDKNTSRCELAWTPIPQVFDDGVRYGSGQGIRRVVPGLPPSNMQVFVPPVDVIQAKMCRLSAPQAVRRQEHQHGVVPSSDPRRTVDDRQHRVDLGTSQESRASVVLVDARGHHHAGQIESHRPAAVQVREVTAERTTFGAQGDPTTLLPSRNQEAMNDFGLKGTQGHFAFAGKKGHKSTASTADSPDGPLLERPQGAKGRAVSFHQFGVRIGWGSKFRGGDDPGLLQVTEKTIEGGLGRGRRWESGREFREKGFHGLGESRGIQPVVFSQILPEAKQAISILAQVLGG